MTTELKVKKPEDRLDYDFDFKKLGWLIPGDTIVAAEVAVSDGTVEIDDDEFTDTIIKVWLIGGEDGETVTVTATATTAQGRVKEACFRLRIRERC